MLSNTCYTVIVPFLPLEFQKFDLDVKLYGYIFAMYALAVMCGSLAIGKLLAICGRKNILIFGLTLMGASMIGFGFIDYSPSHLFIIIFCLFVRSTQGVASSMIQTTSYAIVAITYPKDQQKYLGILEASIGVGMLLGPIVGSILYSTIGFQGTFYAIGACFIVLVPVMLCVIPPSVDSTDNNILIGEEKLSIDSQCNHKLAQDKPIRYIDLMTRKVFMMTAFCAFLSYFETIYMEPVLSLRVMDFEISSFWIGMFFSLNAITYTLACLIISCVTERFENKFLIVFGMLSAGFNMFLVGPSPILPDSLVLMCVGQFLNGGFSILFLITCLPEMIKDASKIYPDRIMEVTDVSSAVFNFMLGFGQMIGPLYGSFVTGYFGFRVCTDTVAWILICYSLAYFALCNGYDALKHTLKNTKQSRRHSILLQSKEFESELSLLNLIESSLYNSKLNKYDF